MDTLRAIVDKPTGRTRHTLGRFGPTGPEEVGEFPPAAFVEIKANESGFLLLRFDADGQFSGDTWHQSLEEAKEQARFEFGIIESDWTTKIDSA